MGRIGRDVEFAKWIGGARNRPVQACRGSLAPFDDGCRLRSDGAQSRAMAVTLCLPPSPLTLIALISLSRCSRMHTSWPQLCPDFSSGALP